MDNNNKVEFPSYEKLYKEFIFNVVKNEDEFKKPDEIKNLVCTICHKRVKKCFKVNDVPISIHKCCYKYLQKKIDDCKQSLNNYENKLMTSYAI
jgi:hypothetical protein